MFKDTELVKEFHEFYGHAVRSVEDIEKLSHMDLRQCLIKRMLLMWEELVELSEAIGGDASTILAAEANKLWEKSTKDKPIRSFPNIVEVMDALLDLRYFIAGTVLEAGLHEYEEDCFNVIHQNNMTKYTTEPIKALESVNRLVEDKQVPVVVRQRKHPKLNRQVLVLYCGATANGIPKGKVLKPVTYKKVEISDILDTYPKFTPSEDVTDVEFEEAENDDLNHENTKVEGQHQPIIRLAK